MSRTRNLRGALTQVCAPTLRRTKFSDVFERDPFKIQSYNFHYAERPAYAVQNFRRPEKPKETPDKAFATYYYNPNFKTRHDQHNKENECNSRTPGQRATKFDEFRRRKFLYESMDTRKRPVTTSTSTGISEWFKQLPSATVTPQQRQKNNNKSMFCRLPGGVDIGVNASAGAATTNSPLLRTCCNRTYLQRCSSSTCCLPHQTSSTNVLSRRDSTMQPQRRSNSQQSHTSILAQASNSRVSLATGSVTHINGAGRGVHRTPSTNALYRRSATQLTKETASGTVKSSMPAKPATTTRREISKTRSTNVLNAILGPKRSTCSGCEININISAMDDNEPSENVRIKIETDGCLMSKNTASTATKTMNTRAHARSRSMADYSRSQNSIVHIDKHLSKYSLNGLNHNVVATPRPMMRTCERNAQEEQKEHEAERERARERERERVRLRELDREKDNKHLAQLEREREHERQLQIENQKLAQMTQRLQMLNDLRRQCELERHARQIRAPLVQVVPMTSHLYRQSSTERIPSIVPLPTHCMATATTTSTSELTPTDRAFNRAQAMTLPTLSLTEAKENSQRVVRAQRTQNACNVLGNLRGLKPSTITLQASNTALLSRRNSSKLSLQQSRTSFDESKLMNTNNHLRTTLNNVPLRITTSISPNKMPGRPLSDVDFRAVRVRHGSLTKPFTQSPPPYNVNINVYADKMKMMRL